MELEKKWNEDYQLSNFESIKYKLKNYITLKSNLRCLSDMYNELFNENYLKAQVLDDMPKGDGKSDPTAKFALSELIPRSHERLSDDIKKIDNNIFEVLSLINCPILTDTQKIILKTKYVDGVKWDHLSYKLSEIGIYYSKSGIQSQHDKAINKIHQYTK